MPSTNPLSARVAVLLGTIIVASWGCQSTPQQVVETVIPATDSATQIAQIQALLDRAARDPADQAAMLYLQASLAYANLASYPQATRTFALIEPGWLPRDQLPSYQLLNAQLAIFDNDLVTARTALSAVAAAAAEPNSAESSRAFSQRLHEVRGRLCAADGDYVCAANQLMNANAVPRYKHNDLIWGYMGRASGYAAIRLASSATADADSVGWWRLKADLLQCHSTREQWDVLAAWRMAWPDHPANLRPPLAVQGIDAARWQPQHIGLLLPLSGGLSRAGRAIRDGFIAAYLSRRATPAEPGAAVAARRVRVSFYDSQAQPLPQLYERVLTDGVDFLIGPLQKELVAELNALNPEIPTLALNYLDSNDLPSANLLQLGLVIEDEAHTIGQRMQADGIENLLLLHTYDEWSLRAKRELESHWQGPITIQSFTDIKTITEAVGVAMNVSTSQARHQALSDAFSFDLEFLPRARHDLHGIIALVDNVEANALVPALRFHFAQDLPVYASSQSIRGARAAELSELEGFRVSELPWHLFDDPLYRTIDETFGLAENPFSSLYALGVDALRVSERISSLNRSGTSQMLGSTGVLALLADGKFRRELTWGVVRRSSLQPLPF